MIGEKLGSFRIDSVLGTGAMGMVYKATNVSTGKVAAVKVIAGDITQRSKSHERFRREAEILKQFRHPNIVRFLALGRSAGTSYFAMEFVPGETLEQVLRRRSTIPWREVVDLAIQTCDALHYAHEHGVVHRDLKPSNLMLSESGQIKLTDFGIAKDLDATALTATGRTLGTAAYMAPEQIRGTPEVSHKTDLYALGVVFYQMLTGRSPFEGPTAVMLMHSHLNESPPRASAKVPDIPRALDDLIIKMMAKSPTDRPWDAAAVGVILTELRDRADRGEVVGTAFSANGSSAPTETEARTREGTKKPKKKKARRPGEPILDRARIEIGLMVLGLAAIVGFVGYMLWPPSAQYLYRNAERLMASKQRHDWIEARDNYLDPLDQRFPNNPYRATTRVWRDRIPLDEAEGRVKQLESGIPRIGDPNTNAERQFVIVNKLVREDRARGDDLGAAAKWDELVRMLKDNEPDEHPWVLLARKRAAELRKEMDERRKFVDDQLVRAELAARSGRDQEAATIRGDLVSRYARYTDLVGLLENAGLKASPPSQPEPARDPSTPKGASAPKQP